MQVDSLGARVDLCNALAGYQLYRSSDRHYAITFSDRPSPLTLKLSSNFTPSPLRLFIPSSLTIQPFLKRRAS